MIFLKKHRLLLLALLLGYVLYWLFLGSAASRETVLAPQGTPNGDTAVVLHGITRSSKHMQPVAEALSKAGFSVLNLDYPSTKYTLDVLTAKVQKQLQTHLYNRPSGGQKVHFVGYSMGGLIVRALLEKHRPANLGRVVQLATPNQGSEVADFFQKNWLFRKVFGPAGQQLTTADNTALASLLGTVDYELGIVAGTSTVDPISSAILPGEDDGKVTLASTRIAGMKDHTTVDASHIFFPSNKKVQRQTVHFLQHGKFDHFTKTAD